MLLDSARDLKKVLSDTILAPLTAADPRVKGFALPAGPIGAVAAVQPSLAVGIAPHGTHDFRIAVRAQRRELMSGREIDQISKKARGEVDIRYVGPITKRATPWGQQRHRPLKIGVSVGHVDVTAGTLGCFVREPEGEETFILSNNHVLANENRGRKSDTILQPGKYDGGRDPEDKVAEIASMIRLKKSGTNAVDAAIARLVTGIDCDSVTIRGLGKLAGLGPEFLDGGTEVAKYGRTTELTRGRVTAFEMDNVVAEFGIGNLRFDNQFEVEGADENAFSEGGDSGSLIVEANTRLAVGLLFAGTDIGGANGLGLTYANPIHVVLAALKVNLWLG